MVDARSLCSDKPDDAKARVQALSKRRNSRGKKVGGEIPLSTRSGLSSKLKKAEKALSQAHTKALEAKQALVAARAAAAAAEATLVERQGATTAAGVS